jgi:hypothetical protein
MNEAAPTPLLAYLETAAPRTAFGIGPDGSYTRGGQVLAFACGLVTMAVFFPMLVPAALLYTRAEAVFQDDPDGARPLYVWSWLCVTVAPAVLAVPAFAVMRIVTA